ncbi:MAG TPA: glycoside hydrolase family 97 protein [Puia sp.]|nr:glycoside hydrolase family 97 protein [Puia sp.]
MKKFLLCILLLDTIHLAAQSKRQLKSPNGLIRVTVETRRSIQYSLYYNNRPLLLSAVIDMELGSGIKLSNDLTIRKISLSHVNDSIFSPVPEKRKIVRNVYNELKIDFSQRFTLILRAYDDGFAYRLVTHMKDSVIIRQEKALFNFAGNYTAYYPEVQKRADMDIFHTSFEEPYQVKPLDSIGPSNLCFTPVLVDCENGIKALITESDLEDYPGMFLQGTANHSLEAVFAPFPLEEALSGGDYPQAYVTKRADYLAHCKGNRAYPWRVIAISSHDRELPGNDIVYRLASASRVPDPTWINPGKGTDEWTIGINLFNLPFVAGINTATYKYYIDFAKRFGFDRIMMDAGWSDYQDLFKINPNLDMEELAAYSRTKGIKLSLWTLAYTLNRQLDSALAQFNRWGVDFIMTDFIDRDDQKAVDFYFRIAEACASKQIMLMYHGAYKPAGFERTFPNALTRESVLGSEYNIWSDKATPRHDLLLPFIRMVSGPMDYEPGLLDNASQKTFRPIPEKVMSQGTRCHQLAMFVVYDNPMQIFSGNPSQGLLEPAFMELLGSIPTTWDETRIVDGKLGEYIVTARKKGNDWFLGAMTDWTPRIVSVSLDFLEPGNYQATICADGVNAARYASDYLITDKDIRSGDSLNISMAPGGGYMLKLKKN